MANVQEAMLGEGALPITPTFLVDPLMLMLAPPPRMIHEVVSTTQLGTPIHIELPLMPNTVSGLEYYIKALHKELMNIYPKDEGEIVGFPSPQGQITKMMVEQAISLL